MRITSTSRQILCLYSFIFIIMSIGIYYSPSGRERLQLGSLDLKRSSGPVASGLQFCCIGLRNLFDNKKHTGENQKHKKADV